MKLRSLCTLLAVSFLALAGMQAGAQTYPSKPLRIMVGFPAGGSIDIVTRVVGQALSEQMGQPVIIDNRPGAGGNLAVDALLRAPADGYTLLTGATGVAVNPVLYRKVNYSLEDLAPITLFGEAPVLFMANPAVPAGNIGELIQAAKKSPGKLRVAVVSGATSQFANDLFRMMSGVDMPQVPYKGGGQAFQDVAGGQVEVVVLPISESLPHVKAQRVKALGQSGTRRSALAPDIPTLDEAGLKGYALTAWYMLFGPAKMPKEAIARLSQEMDRALKNPEVQNRLKGAGVDVLGGTPEQAVAFLHKEHEKLGKLVQWTGAKVE